MASTAGLVPITRAFLAKYYDKYPLPETKFDIGEICSKVKEEYGRLDAERVKDQEDRLVADLEFSPPHKMDENLWKNREKIEELLYLLDRQRWPEKLQELDTGGSRTTDRILEKLDEDLRNLLKLIEGFQTVSSERVANMVYTYMPQDFRGSVLKMQRERSERRRQADVEALVKAGGSIHDRYSLLWKQQMDRRRQLAGLGSATGMYKTIVKYLVGVPQVLLDFVRQINDHNGPMEEQRQRYGPPLYQLTACAAALHIFMALWWATYDQQLGRSPELLALLEHSVAAYAQEFQSFLKFLGQVFENSPFLISAEEAGLVGQLDDFKETTIANGKTHEVIVAVEIEGSLVAWDFQLTSGKDVGFSVDFVDSAGDRRPMLPYKRYDADQGNFYSPSVGCYKLIWDNSYSTFNRKSLRYKVDAIPPVADAIVSDGSEADGDELN
eukprot:TRINITY_DN2929_c0_g1_i3.p1 TRINITY_DN2929_c0_g1~~TRINITY_DN2929_c0_g1_i3.p1  ORF type:complete len:440 (+),score=82.33 TRINITY_DN2929_c0_g1_i3:485-1804(+)